MNLLSPLQLPILNEAPAIEATIERQTSEREIIQNQRSEGEIATILI